MNWSYLISSCLVQGYVHGRRNRRRSMECDNALFYRAIVIPLSAAFSSASAALNAARASRSLLSARFVLFFAEPNAKLSSIPFRFRPQRIALRNDTFTRLYNDCFPLRCCWLISHASNLNRMPSSMTQVAVERTILSGAYGTRLCEEYLQARLTEGIHQLDHIFYCWFRLHQWYYLFVELHLTDSTTSNNSSSLRCRRSSVAYYCRGVFMWNIRRSSNSLNENPKSDRFAWNPARLPTYHNRSILLKPYPFPKFDPFAR